MSDFLGGSILQSFLLCGNSHSQCSLVVFRSEIKLRDLPTLLIYLVDGKSYSWRKR